ncbi:MAG: hypothetical protein FWC01_03910 [Treponema sp.]|nr:hypothetical protein [Treponema sp.]MCL2237306.1 hypothetical protein [Treponema sp.]
MKNIFKFFIAFFSLFVLMWFAGCPIFPELENAASGGILITISGEGTGNASGARTLFPSAPVFTKYELQFHNADGNNTYGPVELDVNRSEILIEDLAVGIWHITAVGYITINGNFVRAADGETEIGVLPGNEGKTTFQSVNIPIRAKPGTGSGTFFYNVDFPSAINTAQLFIYDIGGSPWDVLDENVATPLGTNTPVNILTVKSGRITIPAGYYMMTMKFENDFRSISWTEVIHIYTNMETKMEKIFDESFIAGAITLTGTISATINGVQADRTALYLFTDINCFNHFDHLDASNGQIFPKTMQSFETPLTLYVKLIAEKGDSFYTRRIGSITLHESDYVFNVNEIFNSIKIGGTSNITINGYAPREAYVRAYKLENDELLNVNEAAINLSAGRNGAWEMNIEAFNESTEVYFIVQAKNAGNSTYYKTIEETFVFFNSNRTNIHITADVGLLTVSGTANIKVNGESPKWASITMRKVVANQTVGDWLDSAEVDLMAGNAWIASVNFLTSQINVYFEYACIDADGFWHEGLIGNTIPLYNTNVTGLAFNINISVVNISGTANITVNNNPVQEAYVTMHRSDNNEQLGSAWVDLNQKILGDAGAEINNPDYRKWRMDPIEPFASAVSVYFVVSGFDSNGDYFERNAATVSIYNTDVRNIELNVNISAVTLSGTVTLNAKFAPPDGKAEITAIVKNNPASTYSALIDYAPGSRNWTVSVPSSSGTEFEFRIRWSSDNESYFIRVPDITVTASGANVSGINLGSHDLYPTYRFIDDGTRWAASIGSNWLMKGERFLNGEHYMLQYKFYTENYINDLDIVIRDMLLPCNCIGTHTCFDNTMLSEIRRIESRFEGNETYTGTVVFSINKNASSSDKMANVFYLMASSSDVPFIRIEELNVTRIPKVESASKWEVTLVDSIESPGTSRKIDFNIVGAGITTIAKYGSHDAYSENYNDVLYVRPGPGGYYHFVIDYDLSEEYAGKNIRIDIEYDYYLTQTAALAWHINSANYPTICGNTSQINPNGIWRTMRSQSESRNTTITVPPSSSPGNTGKMLFLSGFQIGNAPAYLRNLRIAITVVP